MTLLLAAVAFSLSAAELKINNRVVGSGYTETADSWNYETSVNLVNEEPPAEFLITPRQIRRHPTSKHICGYNGNILLTVQAPGSIKYIDMAGTIANFPDKVVREAAFSYSLDGVNFIITEKKPFGGEHGHTCTVGAKLELPENNGFVFFKFERFYQEGDRNGKYGNVLWQTFHIKLNGIKSSADVNKDSVGKALKEAFPTGVFWAWERTRPNAERAKMEFWAFVEQNLMDMRENGYDTCWFVNFSRPDQTKLLQLAEKHQIRVLFNTDLLSFFYHGAASLDDLDTLADQTVSRIGYSHALLGYILRDEPGLCDLATTNYLYDLMKKADPSRDTTSVIMNAQSLSYLRDSKMPVVCSDIYYFGSDHSTQLPSPRAVSQKEFTNALNCFNTSAELHGKHSWFMGQMFGDVWGRHYFNGEKVVVYPGSYLHWRMPTEAEAQWQIWEALRLGSKGIFFYVFHSPIPLEMPPENVIDPAWKARIERMDQRAARAKSWKNQKLTETMLELEQNGGMLDYSGRPSPQMRATAGVLKLIRANEKMLVHRRRADFPVFFSDDAYTDTATFVSGGRWIGVAVNRNLDQKRKVNILLPMNVTEAMNLGSGEKLLITAHGEHFQKITLELEAGSGALLEASFFKHPGMSCCHEAFAQQLIHRVDVLPAGEVINHGSMAADTNRSLRLKKDANPEEPVCILQSISNPKKAFNTFTKNMGRDEKKGTLYCLVNGHLHACKVKAISSDDKVAQSNVMHLKNQETEPATPKEGRILQQKEFFRPFVIPPDTTSMEFYLNGGYISDIQIWFVPAASNAGEK